MQRVDKYKLVAAMVRSFFEAFASGVIDCGAHDPKQRTAPAVVKKLMLEHYEQIAPVFFDTLFYPLATLNHSYEEMEQLVRDSQRDGGDMLGLVRAACASDALYEAMVAEYKRNFSNLLAGRFASVADHLDSYTRGGAATDDSDSVEADRSIELTVRVVMYAYVGGLRKACGTENPQFRQVTLFRLLLNAMNVLLCDEAVSFADGDDLGAMFLKVCRSEHNFNVMTAEMDRTHTELL